MGAKILLVEDNPANLHLMDYLLRAFGHVTVSAKDGAQGVALAERESPDVILMDLQLPTLDGYAAAQRIRALPALAHVPIIAVTAFAMVGDRDKVLSVGFDGYISKPIEPETFVGVVERFIRVRTGETDGHDPDR
jgi:two-component system, cell cycle response regulator DivK